MTHNRLGHRKEQSLKDRDDELQKGIVHSACQVYRRKAQRCDAKWVRKELLTRTL